MGGGGKPQQQHLLSNAGVKLAGWVGCYAGLKTVSGKEKKKISFILKPHKQRLNFKNGRDVDGIGDEGRLVFWKLSKGTLYWIVKGECNKHKPSLPVVIYARGRLDWAGPIPLHRNANTGKLSKTMLATQGWWSTHGIQFTLKNPLQKLVSLYPILLKTRKLMYIHHRHYKVLNVFPLPINTMEFG